jgi:anti-sigma factor RsiW
LYLGAEFSGYKISEFIGLPVLGTKRQPTPRTDATWATVPGHPALARYLAEELIERQFDVAVSTALPKPDRGLGHAFLRPYHYLRPDYDLPTVPITINCFFSPAPTGQRCYQFGRAIADIIAAWPADLNVAVLGSGGLWHTPGSPNAFVNQPFDEAVLAAVRLGDGQAMAQWFDAGCDVPPIIEDGGTGLRGHLGGGSGEVRNWITAAAMAEGRPGTVVDYVPIYASPIGVAFAYWRL